VDPHDGEIGCRTKEPGASVLDLDIAIRAAFSHWAHDLDIPGGRPLLATGQRPIHLELHVGSALPVHREGKFILVFPLFMITLPPRWGRSAFPFKQQWIVANLPAAACPKR